MEQVGNKIQRLVNALESKGIDASGVESLLEEAKDLREAGDLQGAKAKLKEAVALARQLWNDNKSPDLVAAVAAQPVEPAVIEVAPAAPCEGDLNDDGVVDSLDNDYVSSRFCTSECTADQLTADANGDGAVDPLDTGFVSARFGSCTA